MRLSKTTNYAIRILIDCAIAETNLVKVADISERRDITLQNTFKIVHLLSRAGFVESVRGRHGGIRLAKPAVEIRVGDVVRAIETLQLEADRDKADDGTPANLDELFDSALEAFITVLDAQTLDDMAKANTGAKDNTGGKTAVAAPSRTPRNLPAQASGSESVTKLPSKKVSRRSSGKSSGTLRT